MRHWQGNIGFGFSQFLGDNHVGNDTRERHHRRSTSLDWGRTVLAPSNHHVVSSSHAPTWETRPPEIADYSESTNLNRSGHFASGTFQNSDLIWNNDSSAILERVNQEPNEPIAPRIVNGTPTNGYASVGLIGDSQGFFCSGTLISSRYVLTAGHCAVGVAATNGRFTVNGVTYSTSRVFVHPQYNDNTLANDIAIYELNRDVVGVRPTQIFRGTPQVGQLLTLVGFGAGGTGNSGHDGTFGTKRVGTTPIDGVEPTLITWRFDNNSESNTAPGDSGGAAFLTVNGIQFLAGITSGGSNADAGIGDESFDTRVDAFKTWVDSIVGTGTGVGGGTDDHANGSGANATRLTFNTTGIARGTGVLETGADRDVFRFDLSIGGNTTLDLIGDNGLDAYLRVYNSAGQLVDQNDDFGNTLNSRITVNLNAGTYYASAGSYDDSGTGTFSLNVQHAVATSDDHGDSFATASTITLNSLNRAVVNAVAEIGSDVDVFRFRVAANGSYAVRATGLSGNMDPILEIYNAQGLRIAYNDDWNNTLNSRTLFQVDANKEYYVRVSTYGETQGAYRINIVQRDILGQQSAPRSSDRITLNLDTENRSLDLPVSLLVSDRSTTLAGRSILTFRELNSQQLTNEMASASLTNQFHFDHHQQSPAQNFGLSLASV